MARKSKKGSNAATPKEHAETAAPVQEPAAADPVQQSGEDSDSGATGHVAADDSSALEAATAKKPSALTAAIMKKLRNYRKKLQRAEQYEQKKLSGGEVNADQILTIAKKEQYQLLVKELGELHQLSLEQDAEESDAMEKVVQNFTQTASDSVAKTSMELVTGILANEELAHKQALRLFSATNRLPRTGEEISADNRAALQGFYELVVVPDEKDVSFTDAGLSHVRALAKSADSLVQGLEGGITYGNVVNIIDQVLAAELVEEQPATEELKLDVAGEEVEENEAKPAVASRDVQEQSKEEPAAAAAARVEGTNKGEDAFDGVRMPKMPSVYIDSTTGGDPNGDFVTKVVVPPGGLTFMTHVDLPGASSNEPAEDKDGAKPEEAAEQLSQLPAETTPDLAMPGAEKAEDTTEDAAVPETETELVGGFAQPAKVVVPNAHTPMHGSVGAGMDPSQQPPAGFGLYSGHPGVGMPNWSAAAATAAGMPGMPGGYGMIPLPYPPHFAI
ncbi:hypothetical protein EC988_001810, partial [Linderina pennispora]